MSVTLEYIRDIYSIVEGGSSLLTDLLAFWKLNESSGSALDELSTYTGTLRNAPTQGSTGNFDTCYTFAAASAQRVTFSSLPAAIGSSDFSISAWVYVTTAGAGTWGVLGNWDDPPYFYITFLNGTSIRARFNFASTNIDIDYTGGYSINTWYNIILTSDRDGLAKLYLNGSQVGSSLDISSGSGVNIDNTTEFCIGSIGRWISGYYFDGRIDEVAIWTKVLSTSEITTLQTDTYPFS